MKLYFPILVNCYRMRSNYCKRVCLIMQVLRWTVLRISSRIIFDFPNDFFPHFLIFEWFQLLSLRNKVCCSNKTGCKTADNKARIAEWLIPPSKRRRRSEEVGVRNPPSVHILAPIKKYISRLKPWIKLRHLSFESNFSDVSKPYIPWPLLLKYLRNQSKQAFSDPTLFFTAQVLDCSFFLNWKSKPITVDAGWFPDVLGVLRYAILLIDNNLKFFFVFFLTRLISCNIPATTPPPPPSL